MTNYNMPVTPSPDPSSDMEFPLELPYYGCPFVEAIRRFFLKYATFKGRASRSEFWFFVLFNAIVGTVLNIAKWSLPREAKSFIIFLDVLWELAILVPYIAIAVRRLHDTNKSGTWLFAPFGSMILGLILVISGIGSALFSMASHFDLDMMDDVSTPDLKPAGMGIFLIVLGLLVVLAGSILFIVLMVAPEDPRGVRFDDPRFVMNTGTVGYGPSAAEGFNQQLFNGSYAPGQYSPFPPQGQGQSQAPSPMQLTPQPNPSQQFAQQPVQPYVPAQERTPQDFYSQPSLSSEERAQWVQPQPTNQQPYQDPTQTQAQNPPYQAGVRPFNPAMSPSPTPQVPTQFQAPGQSTANASQKPQSFGLSGNQAGQQPAPSMTSDHDSYQQYQQPHFTQQVPEKNPYERKNDDHHQLLAPPQPIHQETFPSMNTGTAQQGGTGDGHANHGKDESQEER